MSLVLQVSAAMRPASRGVRIAPIRSCVTPFYAAYDRMRQALEAARPDALVVIGAEHFANFFMNNMPAICVGMGDHYEGPIEDEAWLGINTPAFPALRTLSMQIIQDVMNDVDLAYAQEWKFDHGIMVPLHFLTPRADLPIIPVNINCQGPPLIPLQALL
jgi:aromatic ring-opening dioxygenase catalytic subunit (LigB family)